MAAAGFTNEPVTIPPDPPTITSIESTTGGLEVQWDAVADISGYDIEWRHDTEQTWRSTRTDQRQHTIGGLADGALYWVRVRAVKTHESLTGQTLYTTAWSEAQPGVAGDWAPRNLQVIPGDRSFAVTWDTVPAANDYDVEYRPAVSVAGRWVPVDAEARGGRWRADAVGLDNGEAYDVRVRSVRALNPDAILPPSLDRQLESDWVEGSATPGVGFEVADVVSPPTVLGGRTVDRVLRFTYPRGAAQSGEQEDVEKSPLAYVSIGVRVLTGPNAGVAVRCSTFRHFYPHSYTLTSGTGSFADLDDDCVTDSHGRLRVSYDTTAGVGNANLGKDSLGLHVDYGRDGVLGAGEVLRGFADGAVQVVRPRVLVALGDSFSAGQQGAPGDVLTAGERTDESCSRWLVAYPEIASRYDAYFRAEFRSFACSGAITLNIVDPDDSENLHPTATPGPGVAPARGVKRQGASFRERHDALLGGSPALSADMVALTIGGNDLGFSSVFRACFLLGCDAEDVELSTGELVGRVRSVLSGLKGVTASEGTSRAAVFLLGYPSLIPPPSTDLDDCKALSRDRILEAIDVAGLDGTKIQDLLANTLTQIRFSVRRVVGSAAPPVGALLTATDLVRDFGASNTWQNITVDAVVGGGLVVAAGLTGGLLAGVAVAVLVGLEYGENYLDRAFRIDDTEHEFLWDAGRVLNDAVRDAASAEGVHFVEVAAEFADHYACGDEDDREEPWIHGFLAKVDTTESVVNVSDASLHPNPAGHRAYARILNRFVEDAIDEAVALGRGLNRAGLPVEALPPVPPTDQGPGTSIRGDSSGAPAGKEAPVGASDRSTAGPASARAAGAPTVGTLLYRRAVPVSGVCGGLLSPGEVVRLTAGGFAADSAVTFTAVGATVPAGAASPPIRFVAVPAIPAGTADTDGEVSASWTVPAAPAAATDAAPRWYIIRASGTNADGAAYAAYAPRLLVVYPGVEPCAVADTATTTLGTPVRVALLANDTAPAGGTLDPTSVHVTPAAGGGFAVDPSDGAVTFTPDAGFAGTVQTTYWVYDNWGLGVRAEVSVTVDAGCTITGAAGVVEIDGTDGDDVICVAAPEDPTAFHVIDARAGNDVIIGGDGVDWIDAGAGADVIYGRRGEDRIDGGVGVDTIYGGDGFDTILSADLADAIVDDADGYELLLTQPTPAAPAAPVASGDEAHVAPGETLDIAVLDNDFDPNGNLVATSLSITSVPTLGAAHVVVSAGGDVLVRYVAGDSGGIDTFAYEVCDTLDACATGQVIVTVGTSRCTIVGTGGDDVLRGTPGADVICGLGGDDVINGIGGDDVILGGDGDDTLTGANGDDTLVGGPGADTLIGGAGADALFGGAGDDTLAGNTQNDVLHGGPGDDDLNGGGGDDVLWAGGGDDSLVGHAGNDTLHGGPGEDTMDDALAGGNGDDTLYGGPGADTLIGGAGADTLYGGPGGDSLWGNTQNDVLRGGEGNDHLYGGGHDDALLGGAGKDTLYGNAGDDRLWGDGGDDRLDGGNGVDYIGGGDGVDSCGRGEVVAGCES